MTPIVGDYIVYNKCFKLIIKEYIKAMQTYRDIQGKISYLYRHYDYTSDPEVQQSILREIKEKTTEKMLQATMEYDNLA